MRMTLIHPAEIHELVSEEACEKYGKYNEK
jgi:hypothetical protein